MELWRNDKSVDDITCSGQDQAFGHIPWQLGDDMGASYSVEEGVAGMVST